MPTTLILARNHRSAMAHATTAGIPWADRVYVARPEIIRDLGATKGVPRLICERWEEHPQARAIADALYVSDLYTPVPAGG